MQNNSAAGQRMQRCSHLPDCVSCVWQLYITEDVLLNDLLAYSHHNLDRLWGIPCTLRDFQQS